MASRQTASCRDSIVSRLGVQATQQSNYREDRTMQHGIAEEECTISADEWTASPRKIGGQGSEDKKRVPTPLRWIKEDSNPTIRARDTEMARAGMHGTRATRSIGTCGTARIGTCTGTRANRMIDTRGAARIEDWYYVPWGEEGHCGNLYTWEEGHITWANKNKLWLWRHNIRDVLLNYTRCQ